MKYRLLVAGVLALAPLSSWAENCAVQIKVDLPRGIDHYHPYVKADSRQYPISEAKPEVCLSKAQLGVYPRQFPQYQLM